MMEGDMGFLPAQEIRIGEDPAVLSSMGFL